MTFEKWMTKVDAEISRICGMTSDELPDYTYRDCFESDMDPEEAAYDALDYADFPFDELDE